MRTFVKIVLLTGQVENFSDVLDIVEFFSPAFINPTFQFSPIVKNENLDFEKSEIYKHPSFLYWPIVKYENLDFKNPRFPNTRLFDIGL